MSRFRVSLVLAATVTVVSLATLLGPVRGEEEGTRVVRQGPTPMHRSEHRVGERIANLDVVDLDGTKRSIASLLDEADALVLAFTSVDCPLSKKYGPSLAALENDYAERKVVVVFVDPIEGDEVAKIRDAAKAYGWRGTILRDPDGALTRELGARRTTDAFVLDPTRTLTYRGAVDDQYGFGFSLDAPRTTLLRDAIDATLAGLRPRVEATIAPGCELADRAPALPRMTKTTWHNRISRIVQRNCQECHRPGEAGPFPLMTYADARKQAKMIGWAVENQVMPPWFAAEGEHGFSNDRSLSARDRDDLLGWVEAGAPEGDPADAPRPVAWPDGWRIGKPDVVHEIPTEVTVPRSGAVRYQYFVVDPGNKEDLWVRGMEIRPTAPENVHHVLVFLRYPKNHVRWRRRAADANGLNGYFAGMVPGQSSYVFPEGYAKRLPAGAQLMFQIHYVTTGREVKDRTKLGLIFQPEAPRHEIETIGLFNAKLKIPPHAANHQSVASRMLRERTRVFGFMPHMHVRGKAFKYEMIAPDAEPKVLLDVPEYDFNWQLFYELETPIDLPAGVRLRGTAWFDNSDGNPANPDPSKTVFFGEQTWEEMHIGYVDVAYPDRK